MDIAKMTATVDAQANDLDLWKYTSHPQAVKLQEALRLLHEIAEGRTSAECARRVLD